ncbi:amidophosphoribosyltransferase [Patescibacteria group bacterium]|nr:amidophosphoribosyltransferase [Patescibacteria group bacterium]
MCGVFGIISNKSKENLVEIAYLGLLHLQHRGQDAAGLAYNDNGRVRIEKGKGLVNHIFNSVKRREIASHKPWIILGHTRYSTAGADSLINTQPHWIDTLKGRQALASNGDIPNLINEKKILEKQGVEFYTDNDGEFLLKKINFLASNKEGNLLSAIIETMKSTAGSYSAALMVRDQIFIFRDPWGNRPFILGEKNGSIIFTSETCALDGVGAKFVREINPGEVIHINQKGELKSIQAIELKKKAHCIFEHIYFARPDSKIFGQKEVGAFRYRLGKKLAKAYPVKADFVTSVPDSGNFAAIGYSVEAKIPYRILLVRNPYIPRTFIMPGQQNREYLARLKYSVMKEILKTKNRVILVDDSIVRGTTNKAIIKMMREAGAKEIHLRISSPPIINPCHYGINTPTQEELIACSHSIEEIRKFLEVDSLGYLSLEDLKNNVKKNKQKPENFCFACFNKKYPI